MHPVFWLFLIVILLVVELLTQGLTTLWFAGGALLAFLAALLGLGLPFQIGVFVAVSVILLIFTRPVAARYLNSRTVKTNVESMAGKRALVTEDIDNRHAVGMVQVDGVSWTARSSDDSVTFSAGAEVIVEEVQGVKLIVSGQEERRCQD